MGKKLKSGYTTGSCCTAAIIAGLNYLLDDRKLENVQLQSLNNKKINIPISRLRKRNNFVTSSVKKYSGDDPDVTDGIEIFVRIKKVTKLKKDSAGYIIGNTLITCGRGIGKVTKKGLRCEVGKYAINPGPLKMMELAIESILDDKNDLYFEIKIYIPEGLEKSKKTFNPKLGIVGGISILGSTGILNPMSEEALKDSLYIEMKVLKENSNKDYKNIKCVINNSFYTYLNLINIYNMNDETEQILNDSGFESESVMNLLNDKESINNILCLLRKSILGVERYYLNNSNITLEEEYVCDISNYVNKLKDEIKSIDDIIENRSITFIKEKTDTSIDISNDINTTSDDSVSIFTNDEISLNDIDIGTNTESDTATNIKISISDSDDINSSDDDECETINEENSDNDSNGNVFTALYNIYYNIKYFFCRLVGFN